MISEDLARQIYLVYTALHYFLQHHLQINQDHLKKTVVKIIQQINFVEDGPGIHASIISIFKQEGFILSPSAQLLIFDYLDEDRFDPQRASILARTEIIHEVTAIYLHAKYARPLPTSKYVNAVTRDYIIAQEKPKTLMFRNYSVISLPFAVQEPAPMSRAWCCLCQFTE